MRSLKKWIFVIFVLLILGGIGGWFAWQWWFGSGNSDSNSVIRRWLTIPASRSALITHRTPPCENAPFQLPSDGLVGLLWRDPAAPYTPLRRHTGLDIFGDGQVGTVPIYAVYEGYLTRLSDWKSTVIIRHVDPLQPNRNIWTWYTHMANKAGTEDFILDRFPRGTSDVWVEQGTLLGYQGEYAGTTGWVAMHVHLSIVRSDNNNWFRNEAILENTLDPSPYFGMELDIDEIDGYPVKCYTP